MVSSDRYKEEETAADFKPKYTWCRLSPDKYLVWISYS